MTVCVRPANVAAESLEELLGLIRAAAEAGSPLAHASPGFGTSSHLLAEALRAAAGDPPLRHLPGPGGTFVLRALASGEAQLACPPLVTALRRIRAGELRALAVTGLARAPQLPDTPTLRAAFPAEDRAAAEGALDMTEWFGVVGPAGMPPNALARTHAALREAMELEGLGRAFLALGVTPAFRAGEAFRRLIRDDILRFHALARRAGLVAKD